MLINAWHGRASLTQWLFFLGLRYMTATFASAFVNMTPMFTFLLALPFTLERLHVATGSSAAKLTGTAVGLAGAMVLALYQGPALTGAPTDVLAAAHGGVETHMCMQYLKQFVSLVHGYRRVNFGKLILSILW
jgi:drug/metabolite transporter (DMT)-like permease